MDDIAQFITEDHGRNHYDNFQQQIGAFISKEEEFYPVVKSNQLAPLC